ncbi:MAG: glycosyl transferase [Thiotrichales bacterium]|nr:MAG: glycosyl transferase [Thiotrichales bacterium]
MTKKTKKNILVLHDYFETTEGGGRLVLCIRDCFDADLGCGYYRHDHPFFTTDNRPNYTLRIKCNIPLLKQWLLLRGFLKKSIFPGKYDVVMYSGFYAPLAIDNLEGCSKHILYCHTPPRFVYDKKRYYEKLLPCWQRPLLKVFTLSFKKQYERAVSKMDIVLANSQNVQKRIETYLGLQSKVVYPPCNISSFSWKEDKGYFLSMGRLDPLKRVDRIVRAFQKLPEKQLVVISEGQDFNKIKELARGYDNIEVVGAVSEKKLQSYLAACRATMYIPEDEDFGMSSVESMAAGKPVIGVAEGGLLESIIPGKTGILLDPDFTQKDLIQAIESMTKEEAVKMRENCEKRAACFAIEKFKDSIARIIS